MTRLKFAAAFVFLSLAANASASGPAFVWSGTAWISPKSANMPVGAVLLAANTMPKVWTGDRWIDQNSWRGPDYSGRNVWTGTTWVPDNASTNTAGFMKFPSDGSLLRWKGSSWVRDRAWIGLQQIAGKQWSNGKWIGGPGSSTTVSAAAGQKTGFTVPDVAPERGGQGSDQSGGANSSSDSGSPSSLSGSSASSSSPSYSSSNGGGGGTSSSAPPPSSSAPSVASSGPASSAATAGPSAVSGASASPSSRYGVQNLPPPSSFNGVTGSGTLTTATPSTSKNGYAPLTTNAGAFNVGVLPPVGDTTSSDAEVSGAATVTGSSSWGASTSGFSSSGSSSTGSGSSTSGHLLNIREPASGDGEGSTGQAAVGAN